jgi:hypothetical protein
MWNGFDFFCLRHGIKIQSACILSVQKNTYICRVKRHRRHGYEKLNELNRRSTRGSLYSNVHVRERERIYISVVVCFSEAHVARGQEKDNGAIYDEVFFSMFKTETVPWHMYTMATVLRAYRNTRRGLSTRTAAAVRSSRSAPSSTYPFRKS